MHYLLSVYYDNSHYICHSFAPHQEVLYIQQMVYFCAYYVGWLLLLLLRCTINRTLNCTLHKIPKQRRTHLYVFNFLYVQKKKEQENEIFQEE
jgi:hypothetical protein